MWEQSFAITDCCNMVWLCHLSTDAKNTHGGHAQAVLAVLEEGEEGTLRAKVAASGAYAAAAVLVGSPEPLGSDSFVATFRADRRLAVQVAHVHLLWGVNAPTTCLLPVSLIGSAAYSYDCLPPTLHGATAGALCRHGWQYILPGGGASRQVGSLPPCPLMRAPEHFIPNLTPPLPFCLITIPLLDGFSLCEHRLSRSWHKRQVGRQPCGQGRLCCSYCGIALPFPLHWRPFHRQFQARRAWGDSHRHTTHMVCLVVADWTQVPEEDEGREREVKHALRDVLEASSELKATIVDLQVFSCTGFSAPCCRATRYAAG